MRRNETPTPTVAPPTPMERPKNINDVAGEAAKQREEFYRSQGGRAATFLTTGRGLTTSGYSAAARLFTSSGV